MKRLAAAILVLAALAGPAAAIPPLQPHAAPIVLGVQGAPSALVARADDAIKAASAATGMFLVDPPGVALSPIRACAGRADPRACLRPVLLDAPRGEPTTPVHVAVLVQPARGGLARLTCLGAGKAAKDAAHQSIVVDLGKALSTDAKVREKPLQDISWCVFDAMNEYLL